MRWIAFVMVAGCLSEPSVPSVVGRTWAKRDGASQPGPLHAPKLTYDVKLGHVVMYGGRDPVAGTYSSGMWVLDETGWTTLCDPCMPGPRVGHGFVYDPMRDKVVLFGGYNGASILNDVWEYDDGSWVQQTPASLPGDGPQGLSGVQMIRDGLDGTMLVFGGSPDGSGAKTTTYRYAPADRTWSTLVTPSTIAVVDDGTEATFDYSRNQAISSEDIDVQGHTSNKLLAFDGTSWNTVCSDCSPLGARTLGAMVFDPVWFNLLWIGGYVGGTRLDSVEMLVSDRWQATGETIPARDGWGIAFDEGRNVIVLYGGQAASGASCGGPCDAGGCTCSETWEGAALR